VGADDTDEVETDTPDTDDGGDDPAETDVEDTDGGDTDDGPGEVTSVGVGRWLVAAHVTPCGNGFANGAIGSAVEGRADQFSLRIQGVVEQETLGTLCTVSAEDATAFTCENVSLLGGTVCNVQADYANISGTLVEGAFTLRAWATIFLGPGCPPGFQECGPEEVSASGTVGGG